jgi:hypothetical protein
MKKILLIIGLIVLCCFKTWSQNSKITVGCKQYFLNGPNVAWNNYGWDFGDNAAGYGGGNGYSSSWWEAHFTQLQNYGANSARVWIHCKAEHNPLFDGTGNCTGLNNNFFNNIDDMLNRAKNHNIMIILCLFDFHLVSIGGREQLVRDVNKTNSYINNALIPMVQRYANQCNLIGYEIFNEPEWVMQGVPGAGNFGGSITIAEMQRFVAKCAEAVHNNSTKLVTVGSASLRYNSDVAPATANYWKNSALQSTYSSAAAYLDFYQIHYYDWMLNSGNNWAPYNRPASYWGLDKPVLIGESGNTGHYNYQQQFDLGYSNGFAGTMIWASSASTGGAASWSEFNNQMKAFRDAHIAEVDFSCTSGGCCTKPNMGTDKTTCGGITFPYLLNSNAGSTTNKTYTWKLNNVVIGGAASPAYNASSAGTYIVIVDSGLVQHCISSDTIVLSNVLATPSLGPNVNLCNPAYKDLDGNDYGSTPVTYAWQKNNVTISGETNRYLMNIRTADTYSVIVSSSGCSDVTASVTITTTTGLPVPTDGCRSGAGVVNLSVSGPSTYHWYGSATGTGSYIITGLTYSPSLPASTTTTYWVEDASSVVGQVGPVSQLGGGYGRNPVTDDYRFRTNFNTGSQAVTINSVKVWAWFNNAGTTYYVNIRILDQNSAVISTVDVPVTSTSTGWNSKVLPIGISVPANVTNWKMDARGTTSSPYCDLYYAPNGASYPYNSAPTPGMLTISGQDATWDPNGYSYFYDWQISTGTACGRVPVIATTMGCSAPAPVSLIDFNVYAHNGKTMLIWSTASEQNNAWFEIERSTDQRNYVTIGKVKGIGNSISVVDYSYEDKESIYGISYYRLRQVDYDGAYTYSSVKSVQPEKKNSLRLYPNPILTDGVANLEFILMNEEDILLSITDVFGNVLFSSSFRGKEGLNSVEYGHTLSSGIYFLTLYSSQEKIIQKIIVQ